MRLRGSTDWSGVALLIIGQALRSLAMIHAANSFSHVVKRVKHDDHVLITHGVYSYVCSLGLDGR